MLLRIEPSIEIVGQAHDVVSARAACEQYLPDAVFLDIEMAGSSGLLFAEHAFDNDYPPIVFVSGHAEFAAHAFDLDAIDFVVKPYSEERLTRAVNRLTRHATLDKKDAGARLRVSFAGKWIMVDPKSVECFHADEKYIEFVYEGRELLLRESLEALETRLADTFVRVHRAWLVQVATVASLESSDAGLIVRTKSGSRVPVSKRLASQVRERFRGTSH